MKKHKTKSESFSAILTRNFVFFSLIIALTIAGIFLLAIYFSSYGGFYHTRKTVADFQTALERGNFDELPVKKLFGKDGWLMIADDKGTNVFSSTNNKTNYTLGELDAICLFGNEENIDLQIFYDASNNPMYLITKRIAGANKEDAKFLLLDTDYTVQSGTFLQNKTKLTKIEFDYLTYNFYNTNKLYKYGFVSNGENYSAVFLDAIGLYNNAPEIILGVAIGAAIIIYVLLLVFFIIYTNKKVKIPLEALGGAMRDLSDSGYHKKLTYKGAREFEEIADTFNQTVEMLDESEQKRSGLEKERRRMIAGLSHDMKTPITVIKGYSKAMADGLVDDGERQTYLETIANRADKLTDLINGLYEYVLIDHPDYSATLERADVAELARAYLAEKYNELTLDGFILEADLPDEAVYCNVDVKSCRRVLENLIGNAVKYNPKGTVISCRLTADGENVTLTVADNGVGIPESVKEHLFEPFRVGSDTRSGQSSGLGLAVCKRIVDAHGGKIILSQNTSDSVKTEFVITLPIAKES